MRESLDDLYLANECICSAMKIPYTIDLLICINETATLEIDSHGTKEN